MKESFSSVETKFEQFMAYENIFTFLFDLKTLKALEENELKNYCFNLQKFLKECKHLDIDGFDLFFELKVLREFLKVEINNPINILNYIEELDSFPNACIIYRMLLTITIIVTSVERSFSKLKLIKYYFKSTIS